MAVVSIGKRATAAYKVMELKLPLLMAVYPLVP